MAKDETENRELKTIKFQMMLAETEAEQIDDWMFEHRIRSRAEAIRRLCQMAILIDEKVEKLTLVMADMQLKQTPVLENIKTIFPKMRENADVLELVDSVFELLDANLKVELEIREALLPLLAFKRDMPFEDSIKAAEAAKKFMEEMRGQSRGLLFNVEEMKSNKKAGRKLILDDSKE